MTTERLPLRIDSTGGKTVRTSVENSSSNSATRDQRAGGPDQLKQCQQLSVAGAVGPQRLAGDDALRMPGHRDRRGPVQVEALSRQRANRGHLGKQDAR